MVYVLCVKRCLLFSSCFVAEGRAGLQADAVPPAEREERLVVPAQVPLHLVQEGRAHIGREELPQVPCVEVGHADMSDLSVWKQCSAFAFWMMFQVVAAFPSCVSNCVSKRSVCVFVLRPSTKCLTFPSARRASEVIVLLIVLLY